MNKSEKDTYDKRTSGSGGFEPKEWRGVRTDDTNTRKHEFCKFAMSRALSESDHEWDTEVECDAGRVDVFDFGPVDGKPVVFEFETSYSPARVEEKREQYNCELLRDVIVIDPAEVPDELDAAVEYFKNRHIIG